MKTNQIPSGVSSRKSTQIPSKAKVSKSLKSPPSVKNSPGLKAKPRTNGLQNPKSSAARKAKPLPPGSTAPPDDATQPVTHSADAIRARAYLNYQKRGSEDGDPTNDWLSAEAELAAEQQIVR